MYNMPDLGSRSAAADGLVELASSSCVTSDLGGSELLPLSPFTALRYHFGMLLGVADFETDQGYHRAKMRLHNAWLHRAGVVWGFGVLADVDHGEVRVLPGLALDAAGHELHLEADACINVNEWFDKHEKDAGFNLNRDSFDVCVAIRFKPCLTRQVPALLEPCENASTGTAYSRVAETIEILLMPGLAPDPIPPYHRLRVLFELEIPPPITQAEVDALKAKESAKTISADELAKLGQIRRDQEVLDALDKIRALAPQDQPAGLLQAFHRFAALDEMDLQPAKSEDGARTLLFPGRENEPVFLANISGLSLKKDDDNWKLSGGKVDTSVRPSHVATTTIQDLLCGSRLGTQAPAPAPDNGPRVDPDSVILLTSQAIEFRVDKDLHDASVKPGTFSVTSFESAGGWRRSDVVTASYSGSENNTVNLELNLPVSGRVRLIVYGTGATPLLGADLYPLAGAVGGPRGSLHNGNDFVYMKDFVPTDDSGRGETRYESAESRRTKTRRTKPAR